MFAGFVTVEKRKQQEAEAALAAAEPTPEQRAEALQKERTERYGARAAHIQVLCFRLLLIPSRFLPTHMLI